MVIYFSQAAELESPIRKFLLDSKKAVVAKAKTPLQSRAITKNMSQHYLQGS